MYDISECLLYAGMEDGETSYLSSRSRLVSPIDNYALNVSRVFVVVKYVEYTAFFLSDGAWDIAEPMLEDLSTKPIQLLTCYGSGNVGSIWRMYLQNDSETSFGS